MRALLGQFVRFLIVGGFGLVIDVLVFNLLRVTILSPDALAEGPFLAKLLSTSLAIGVNWFGNRLWTFRTHGRAGAWREGVRFLLVSLGGMAIGLACLWVSHYLLGFTSLLADNISGNVIGLALGTLFRFWLYRLWVFRGGEEHSDAPAPIAASASTSGAGAGDAALPTSGALLSR